MPRPKLNKSVARLSISLDQADYEALRRLADRNDVSTAWLVRRAVSEFLLGAGQARDYLQCAGSAAGDRP